MPEFGESLNLSELTEKYQVAEVVELGLLSQQLERSRIQSKLQIVTTYTLLVLFAIGNVATLSLFFLNGFGITQLTDVAMGALAAATIAEVSGLLAIVLKGIYSV